MCASFVPEAIDLVHGQSREKLMRAAVRLLGAVSEVGFSCQTPQVGGCGSWDEEERNNCLGMGGSTDMHNCAHVLDHCQALESK
jgi:hypothetical protein